MPTPLKQLLRQQEAPFIVQEGGHIGVYKIDSRGELERAVRIKSVNDVAAALRGLASDEAWLIYAKHEGKATIIAMSAAMERALGS